MFINNFYILFWEIICVNFKKYKHQNKKNVFWDFSGIRTYDSLFNRYYILKSKIKKINRKKKKTKKQQPTIIKQKEEKPKNIKIKQDYYIDFIKAQG